MNSQNPSRFRPASLFLLLAILVPLTLSGSDFPLLRPDGGPAVLSSVIAPLPWGETGHLISGRAAAVNLPGEMPAFFRDAAPQLRYLNPEPDRWRDDDLRAMNEAFRYDHYVDIENLTPEALALSRGGQGPDRFEYRLTAKGRDLFPVLVALMHWGDTWLSAEAGGPPPC